MKIFTISIAGMALLLMLSTLICGLWMQVKGSPDESALNFHIQMGVATVAAGAAAIILLMVQVFRH